MSKRRYSIKVFFRESKRSDDNWAQSASSTSGTSFGRTDSGVREGDEVSEWLLPRDPSTELLSLSFSFRLSTLFSVPIDGRSPLPQTRSKRDVWVGVNPRFSGSKLSVTPSVMRRRRSPSKHRLMDHRNEIRKWIKPFVKTPQKEREITTKLLPIRNEEVPHIRTAFSVRWPKSPSAIFSFRFQIVSNPLSNVYYSLFRSLPKIDLAISNRCVRDDPLRKGFRGVTSIFGRSGMLIRVRNCLICTVSLEVHSIRWSKSRGRMRGRGGGGRGEGEERGRMRGKDREDHTATECRRPSVKHVSLPIDDRIMCGRESLNDRTRNLI